VWTSTHGSQLVIRGRNQLVITEQARKNEDVVAGNNTSRHMSKSITERFRSAHRNKYVEAKTGEISM
jgi:hypothetical protein